MPKGGWRRSMKAVVYTREAKPDRLVLRDVEKPVPKDNEILVSIRAPRSMLQITARWRWEWYPPEDLRSRYLGRCGVGRQEYSTVQAGWWGSGWAFWVWIRRFCRFRLANEKALVIKPAGLSLRKRQPCRWPRWPPCRPWGTRGIYGRGRRSAYWGAAAGSEQWPFSLPGISAPVITAVCSTRNVEQSRLLGAHHVIDYTKNDFASENRKYDLIVAVNGNYSLLKCRKALKPNGRYVLVERLPSRRSLRPWW